ncbi:MAG: Transcriptional regulator, TrmB [Parcubacteria group bacterium GW2011_GWC2_38_7]|nr:MAG: Transcriptional regulator, TrmB [Parcubacteria group bacterium GW2011_GWC2_38_7]
MPSTINHDEALYSSLESLGLTKNEIDLYLISLSLGPSTISNLAKHLNISRPNIYKLIQGLESKGLAKFAGEKKFTRNFIVESPSLVLEKYREQKDETINTCNKLVSLMPTLLAQYHQGSSPTKMKIIIGKEKFLELFRDILEEEKTESQFFGSAKDFIGFISWAEEKEWIRQRIKKGIKIKSLLLPSEEAEVLKPKDQSELRETRVLKGLAPFETSFHLFANKIIIWQPKAPVALFIEDEYIVKMLRSIFEAFWALSE